MATSTSAYFDHDENRPETDTIGSEIIRLARQPEWLKFSFTLQYSKASHRRKGREAVYALLVDDPDHDPNVAMQSIANQENTLQSVSQCESHGEPSPWATELPGLLGCGNKEVWARQTELRNAIPPPPPWLLGAALIPALQNVYTPPFPGLPVASRPPPTFLGTPVPLRDMLNGDRFLLAPVPVMQAKPFNISLYEASFGHKDVKRVMAGSAALPKWPTPPYWTRLHDSQHA
ncbi:hypothetical protein Trihar35433_7471 [Trichoderma harzianum]|nr:hypothetical protein Trihar35433_7471 [Trichoderma harzianum]